jgi:hypothetical protein
MKHKQNINKVVKITHFVSKIKFMLHSYLSIRRTFEEVCAKEFVPLCGVEFLLLFKFHTTN